MSKLGRLGTGIALVLIPILCVLALNPQTGGSATAPSSAAVSPSPADSPSPTASPPLAASSPASSASGDANHENQNGQESHANLLTLYVLLLVLFVSVLHLVDSTQAYRLASRDSDEVWKKLSATGLSADELAKMQPLLTSLPQSASGIAGTTRSILAYSLVIILGIAVFHLLAVPPSDQAAAYAEYADKILVLIAGSLTTAIGFYFGAKATTEGVTAGKTQEPEPPASQSGHIDSVDPHQAAANASVVIKGVGFGKDQGNVQFGDVAVAKIDNWTESSIAVKVPPELKVGTAVDVYVNPAHGERIVGKGLFTRSA